MSLLDPVSPYKKPKNINRKWASYAIGSCEPGVRPEQKSTSSKEVKVGLEQYSITPIMRRVLNKGQIKKINHLRTCRYVDSCNFSSIYGD